jgi:hypothetical protein
MEILQLPFSTAPTKSSIHRLSYNSHELRVRVTLRLAVYRQSVRLSEKSLEIFQLNARGYSRYVTSSLKREWVCHLQLLLVLASAVILKSESYGNHDILLSQIQDSPNLEGQVPVLYSPSTGWPSYTPRHWAATLTNFQPRLG